MTGPSADPGADGWIPQKGGTDGTFSLEIPSDHSP
jgi:hypothetical protein